MDGVPGVNHHLGSFPCCPRVDVDPRLHAFWTCPVALAVRGELERCLGCTLHRTHLWLLDTPPCPGLFSEVWHVVCLAALNAIFHGRKQLWRLHFHSHERGGHTQLTLAQAWGTSPRLPSRSYQARALAIADFWSRLADFVALADAPESWFGAVGPDHPFLSAGGTKVNLPPSRVQAPVEM